MDLRKQLENIMREDLQNLADMIGRWSCDYSDMQKKIGTHMDTSEMPLFKDLVKEALGEWIK